MISMVIPVFLHTTIFRQCHSNRRVIRRRNRETRRKQTARHEQTGTGKKDTTHTQPRTRKLHREFCNCKQFVCVFNYFLRLSPQTVVFCCSAFSSHYSDTRTHTRLHIHAETEREREELKKPTSEKPSSHHRHTMQKRDKEENPRSYYSNTLEFRIFF